jgi:hypothetical protein
MKLQQETAERQEQVALAQQRFEQGMPPTQDAEREWDRMIRRKEVLFPAHFPAPSLYVMRRKEVLSRARSLYVYFV